MNLKAFLLFVLSGCCVAGTPPPSGDTRIPAPLTVAPFSPPAPRPAPALPDCRIDAATVHKATATTTLTLARGEASTAPDLPPPPPPPPQAADPGPPTPEQIARRLYDLRHTFNIGATIIDHRVSILHWTDPETRQPYEAVCGYLYDPSYGSARLPPLNGDPDYRAYENTYLDGFYWDDLELNKDLARPNDTSPSSPVDVEANILPPFDP